MRSPDLKDRLRNFDDLVAAFFAGYYPYHPFLGFKIFRKRFDHRFVSAPVHGGTCDINLQGPVLFNDPLFGSPGNDFDIELHLWLYYHMRIFVAVKAPRQIAEAVDAIKKDLDLDVRWMPPENLHITLIPPFEADDAMMADTIGKLEEIDINRCSAVFTSVSFGPSQKEPRLIWMTAEPSEGLAKLKTDIEKRSGVNVAKKLFIPHITIARFKPEKFSLFKTKELNTKIDLPMTIDSFSLMRSTLTGEGAVYSVIKDFK